MVLPLDLTQSPAAFGQAIPVVGFPDGVAVSPDSQTVYVVGAGSGLTGGVTEVNAVTHTADSTFTVPQNADAIALSPDGSHAYLTAAAASSLYSYAVPAGTPGPAIPLPLMTLTKSDIAIRADGTTAYVTGRDSNNSHPDLVAVNLANHQAGGVIDLSGVTATTAAPEAVAITPDARRVHATLEGPSSGWVVPVATATGTPGGAITFGIGTLDFQIAITPDQAPVPSFTITAGAPRASTAFDASASIVPFGTITGYRWDFGDGTAVESTASPMINHVYTAAGNYTVTLTETDTAGTTGQIARSVVISSGPRPSVSLSASSLAFGTVAIGSVSAPQTVTVTNTGGGPLSISGATLGGVDAGDFRLTANTCSGSSVGTGASCQVTGTFKPTAALGRTAQLTFTDNASGSPQTVGLGGTGSGPVAHLGESSLDFGPVAVGHASSPQPVTVTNAGSAPLVIGADTLGGAGAREFKVESDACAGGTLTPGSSCTVLLTLTPATVGAVSAQLSVADNAAGSPQTVALNGIGARAFVIEGVSPTARGPGILRSRGLP